MNMGPIPGVKAGAHSDADTRCEWYWYEPMWPFQASTLTIGVNTAYTAYPLKRGEGGDSFLLDHFQHS